MMNTETRPPQEYDHIQHHWLISERSSVASIAEWIHQEWYSVGETTPISPEAMAGRGWDYGGPAVPSTELALDMAERSGYYSAEMDDPEISLVEMPALPDNPVEPTTSDLIKEALREQERAKNTTTMAQEALRLARLALHDVDERVHKLCKKLLEEQLGSVYDARIVLYQMTGRR